MTVHSTSVFAKVHMGQRLEYFVRGAKHGSGLSTFADFSKKSKSSITGLYKSQSLDLSLIELVCEFYNISLCEFLGISEEDLPSSFSTTGSNDISNLEKKINRIDQNVREILNKISKN